MFIKALLKDKKVANFKNSFPTSHQSTNLIALHGLLFYIFSDV